MKDLLLFIVREGGLVKTCYSRDEALEFAETVINEGRQRNTIQVFKVNLDCQTVVIESEYEL